MSGNLRQLPNSTRFGAGASTPDNKREQRRKDAAAGLLPFAVKLPADLIKTLRERALSENADLNALTATLLERALQAK